MRTIYSKDDKTPVRGKEATWIPKNKVQSFMVLFLRIVKEKGSQEQARKFIPIGGATLDSLNKGKLTTYTAKRILDAYNSIC